MANTVPASEPAPDIGLFLAGQQLDEAVAALGEASNWAQAYNGSGTPRILQCYPMRGSGAPGTAIATYATNAQHLVSEWRIPDTRGAVSVDCYIWAKSSAGNGDVEFRSVIGGAVTGVQVIGAAYALHGPFALTIDASGGFETVRMYLDGNGDTISWLAVLVVVPPESSPLPAGAQPTTGAVAVDAGELAADEPAASDSGAQIRANAFNLRDVPHVYLQWSGIDYHSTSDPEAERMAAWPHVIPVIVWADTTRDGWTLTVHVRCTPDGAVDQYVRVHAGLSASPSYLRTCEITVPSGGAQDWFTGTLALPNLGRRRALRNMPSGWESVLLVIWPRPTEANAPKDWSNREGGDVSALTSDAEINSISIWGR